MPRRNQDKFINSITGKEDQIRSTKQIVDLISTIEDTKLKALASILYLTGARVSEIINNLRLNQIRQVKKNGYEFLHFVNIITKKRRDSGTHPRTIPVLIDENTKTLLKFMATYINDPRSPIKDDDILFKYSREHVSRKLNEKIGINCHRLRHYRNTLLVIEHGFTDEYLKKYNNWTDTRPAQAYVHLKVDDLADKYIKKE